MHRYTQCLLTMHITHQLASKCKVTQTGEWQRTTNSYLPSVITNYHKISEHCTVEETEMIAFQVQYNALIANKSNYWLERPNIKSKVASSVQQSALKHRNPMH